MKDKTITEEKKTNSAQWNRQIYEEPQDSLTGLYRKAKFLEAAADMVRSKTDYALAIIHMDINKFQLYNSFFGVEEGDRLIRYIADLVQKDIKMCKGGVYCREHADVFYLCVPYENQEKLIGELRLVQEKLNQYTGKYALVPAFGIYLVRDEDRENPDILKLMDRAKLASKTCKGNYVRNYAYYDDKIEQEIYREQLIANNMKDALINHRFVLYFQPKYEILNNNIEGAEVLVRWLDKDNHIIPPNSFIPIFEKNGFIMELDYYVWEETCKILRKWIDEGKQPLPVSVNISRVSLNNPNLFEQICDLVKKYNIPPAIFQLELTESAYSSNPAVIQETMRKLQRKGFYILMDDFGSGYSSLNVLKDIAVDILKIDMKFMSKSEVAGRSENILASVIRMAKWLNMPVVAEGVESEEQVEFLRGIGCEFVQGFYFEKPMTVEEYETLVFTNQVDSPRKSRENLNSSVWKNDKLWEITSNMEILFSNMLQAVAVYEYDGETVNTIRVNEVYYNMFRFKDLESYRTNIFTYMDSKYQAVVKNAFEVIKETKGVTECEYLRRFDTGKYIWVSMKLKYISEVNGRQVVFGLLSDISMQKEVDKELQKYRTALSYANRKKETLLVVDDIEVNRSILTSIFEESYDIYEAENGREALDIIRDNHNKIDLILLDLTMPVLDGRKFLEIKYASPDIDHIPVIIITADTSSSQQVSALAMGASDYIVKPFIPEVVMRRVQNVLESNRRFGKVLYQYNHELDEAQRDELTGLYNRKTADQMIRRGYQLASGVQAMILLDIDDFKHVNDNYGHSAGDRVLKECGAKLKSYFRQSDMVARYGGDEFLVYVTNIPSKDWIVTKCKGLLKKMQVEAGPEDMVTCSIGIAITENNEVQEEEGVQELFEIADKALYMAKENGKNQCIHIIADKS